MVDPDGARQADEPHFLIGRDRGTAWVVLEVHGRCGGVFRNAVAALRYAREASGDGPAAIEFASGPLDLPMPGRPNKGLAKLDFFDRCATKGLGRTFG